MNQRHLGEYPPNWKAIAAEVKAQAGWRCVRCQHPHEPGAGYTLTVHHLDANKENIEWYNLAALCQRCHLRVQGKVVMARPWILPHSEWFKPFAGGYFAKKYLGLDLSRDEVMSNLDYYANLERSALEGNNGSHLHMLDMR